MVGLTWWEKSAAGTVGSETGGAVAKNVERRWVQGYWENWGCRGGWCEEKGCRQGLYY